MTIAEHPSAARFDVTAPPLVYAAAWAEAVEEAMRLSISTWSSIAKACWQANQAYAEILGRAINLEGLETLPLADTAEQVLRGELHALEDGVQHLAFSAEEVLADLAGAPLIALPD
jgi:hypothetical protein